jgi:hypothetical protein
MKHSRNAAAINMYSCRYWNSYKFYMSSLACFISSHLTSSSPINFRMLFAVDGPKPA